MKREAIILDAAKWLATHRKPPKPVIPAIMKEFPLSATEAAAAVKEAGLIKARAT